MTITDHAVIDREPSHALFRLTTLVFALLLGAQSAWLLIAEYYRPEITKLPTDAAAATAAAGRRGAAASAASIGAIRGELWAELAFTYANLVVGGSASDAASNLPGTFVPARADLDRALDVAPTQSDAWLLRAELGLLYPASGIDGMQALKMSYYTGPSEERLIPLRLNMAVRVNKFNDIEMSQLVSRDLRLLLARKQSAVIVQAYNAASADGKDFIEQSIGDLEPSLLNSLRAARTPQQSSPKPPVPVQSPPNQSQQSLPKQLPQQSSPYPSLPN
jgi:hypothetical protein